MTFPNADNEQARVIRELREKLWVMLDNRRASNTNVVPFKHASDRSQDALLLDEYQALVGEVARYFFRGTVQFPDYQILKAHTDAQQQSVAEKRRKNGGATINQRAQDFMDITARILVAGIKELSKHELECACIAAEQLEAELDAKSRAALQQAQFQQDPDEIKTEKELALQAQLPFNKEKKLVMQLKTDLENALRARNRPSPTPHR